MKDVDGEPLPLTGGPIGTLTKIRDTLLPKLISVTTRVKVSFPTPSGCEVCQIDVSPASQPVFIETTDRNGQRVERFYVRSGNTSRESTPSEMSAYVKERFK